VQMIPDAPLIIAKAADSDGIATSWSVLEGVVFCVENGARLINVSLGSPNQLTGFSEFLDWVDASDAIIISPIGNNDLRTTLYPAGYSKVLCVTGLLPDNTKAPFSNWDSGAKVSAPATGMRSAWHDGGTAIWSGTSFSAPLVTACIASALNFNPNRTTLQIRDFVKGSGRNIDNLNPNYRGQLGRLLNFEFLIARFKK
jgi:thermitase